MSNNLKNSKKKRMFGAGLAIFGWFCVILQFCIATETFANVISYFTILCNLLITVSLTFSILFPLTKLGIFFSKLTVQTAITLYIFIVFIIYNTVLRGLLILSGWDLFLDNMLHVVIPILYILYWVIFIEKKKLQWKTGLYWMIFPAIYLVYSLIRGSVISWYPYPFLNAEKFGYDKIFINILLMMLVFFVSGFALIFINNKLEKRSN